MDLPIGPSVEAWRAMSADERDRFCQTIYDAFNASPEAMAEGRPTMTDGIEQRAVVAEARVAAAEARAAAVAREAVLDLAEAFGVEVTPEWRARIDGAGLEELRRLRGALKATRGFGAG